MKERGNRVPNLRLLQYAVALDQRRSFARAAQAMRVTQPTFSRGVAALEKFYRTRLFVRTSRHVEPTPEGAVFLVRAAALLAEADHLRNALAEYRSLHSGRITIGAGPYPLDLSVIEAISRLTQQHPRLQVELVEGRWRDFGDRLLSGAVEVAVVEASILAGDPRFEVELLPRHQGCFYARRAHPLAERAELSIKEVLDYPIVGVPLPPAAFSAGKLAPPRLTLDATTGDVVPNVTTTSIAAAREIVKRTNGIGIAPPIQIAADIASGTLVVLSADARHLWTGYGIAQLRDKVPSPGVRAFIDVLKKVEAEIVASSRSLPPAVHRRGSSPSKA